MSRYSVVIPAFNAATTLGDAIESVLGQTIPPAAVVVVDDGSTDGTADVARQFGAPVTVICQPNAGPGAATTRGFQSTDTPLVASLDADDLWLPHKAERQINYLAEHPDTDATFALLRHFGESVGAGDPAKEAPGWSRTTMMVRTELVEALGPMLDLPGMRGELVDWLARAREAGARLDMLQEVLALRRIRPGSLSYGRDGDRDRGYLHAARLAIMRRRQGKPDSGG